VVEQSIPIAMGLVFGSFANVVIARLPLEQSIVRPGSHCPHCKKPIRWYQNIPIASYLALRGRCAHCKKGISPRYPIVELLCAVLFLASWVKFGGPSLALFTRDWPFLFSLLCITFIDLDHRIIPDWLSLGTLALGLATCWMRPEPGWALCLIGAAAGFSVFYSIAWLYQRLRGYSGLGGGDIKLLAMLGAFLGPMGVFASVLISSIAGTIAGLALALARRDKKVLQISIPYGPFLVLGGLYYYFLGDVLWFQFMTPM